MAASSKACRYHPGTPARWHCPDCAIHFCSRCVPANERSEAFCPVCDRLLNRLEFSAEVPPFWKRMPAAFLYPLHPASLVFLIIMSLASLLQLIPLGGIIAALLLPFILMKYAFQVLQSTAVGHLKPPKGSTSMSGRDFELPVKAYLLLIVIAILGGLSSMLGLIAVIIALVGLTIIFPAMIMVLGVTRSFFQAISPMQLIEMVRMIGPSYLGLVGMLILLVGASSALMMLLGPTVTPSNFLVIIVVADFISSYYSIVMFHLMGYVIYQFHEELGVKPEVEYEPAAGKKKSAEPAGLSPVAKAQLLVQEGHPEVAKPFIAKHLSNDMSAQQIQLHELYLKLLKQLGEHEDLGRVGGDYILSLMEHGHGKKALQIFRLCYEVDPQFQLNHAEHTHSLMQAAQKASDYDLMLALANNFAKRFPTYPGLFELYLSVARVLHEHFKRDKQASSILQSLITKFPQHEGIQQAKMALARIGRSQQPA
ncbi:MAG TPA: hypothetical protein VNI58_00385 [Mariprofundaceae bacterium]|nr:hypothetical protein [Mariprofundaceae bacterium]